MKYFIITALLFFNLTISAQSKIKYGIALDVYQSRLHNIDRELFLGYGHSVPGFKQTNINNFGVTLLAERSIKNKFSFQTGIGIKSYGAQFNFDYVLPITIERQVVQLDIDLRYITVPLNVNYYNTISNNSKCFFGAGIETKFLVAYKDNYQDNLYYGIGGQTGIYRYNRWIVAPQIMAGYAVEFKNRSQLKLAFVGQYDLVKTVKKEPSWGFYNNLKPASFINYGLSLQYFFLNPNMIAFSKMHNFPYLFYTAFFIFHFSFFILKVTFAIEL